MAKTKETVTEEKAEVVELDIEKADLQTRMTETMSAVGQLKARTADIDAQLVLMEQSALFVLDKYTDSVEVRNFKVKMGVIGSALDEAANALGKVFDRLAQAKD